MDVPDVPDKAVPDVWEVFTDNFREVFREDHHGEDHVQSLQRASDVRCYPGPSARCRHGFWCRYALMKYRMFETDFAEGEMEDWHRIAPLPR